MMTENEKKLIIDEDWKKQAQTEKEKLAQQEAADKKQKEKHPLPEPTFASLVNMLATQTLFALGIIAPKGMEDQVQRDLNLARYNIDLLAVIEQKSKGNLTDEEKTLLSDTLSQLRMAFVQISSIGQE